MSISEQKILLICTFIFFQMFEFCSSNDEIISTNQKIKIDDNTSILVFPIDVPAINDPRLGRQFATALALALERTGVKNIEIVDSIFQPQLESRDNIDALANDFSVYVKQNPVKNSYAFFSQFIGDQKTGPQSILSIVVDSNGVILWSARCAHGNKIFDKYNPKGPLECCFIAADSFTKITTTLSDPIAKNAPRGKWDNYFNTKNIQQTLTGKYVVRIVIITIGCVFIIIGFWSMFRKKKKL